MRVHTAIGKFFVCIAAMLLVVLPATPAFAADGSDASEMGRGTSFVLHEGTMVKASIDHEEGTEPTEDADYGGFAEDLDGIGDVGPNVLEDETIPVPYLLEPPTDPGNPTVAEQEQSGPKAPDSSKQAIQQAATHIATPADSKKADEATRTVGDPSASLQQTGDTLMEGLVVALGGVVVVAVSLLLYHFRKE